MQELADDNNTEIQESVNESDGFTYIDDLEAQALFTKKMRFRYLSSSSSDEEVDNEILMLNDKVRIASSDDETNMEKDKGNQEVIKSPVRICRSERARKATKKSLDYYKEMRKGR
jgi:hypothetical protein